jgi:hypothetical protein
VPIDPIIGPLVGPWNVEQATVNTLKLWMPLYLVAVENWNSVPLGTLPRPPAPESIHGGDDFDTWRQDQLPSLIVVTNPSGNPERESAGDYGQMFETQVSAVVIGDTEDDARRIASFYGSAAAVALSQNGSLGKQVDRTRLTQSPSIRFPNADERRIARATMTFEMWVSVILTEQGGPSVPPTDPFVGENPWYEVQTTEVDVTGVPVTSPV